MMHTDSHSGVSLGFILPILTLLNIYQDIEIRTSPKSDKAFHNLMITHGPKGSVTTKAIRRIFESFATVRCEDGERWTPHEARSFGWVSASPPPWSRCTAEGWDDMKRHGTTMGQALQGVRPCPARRCESWTTCLVVQNKLSGDGQWDKMMLYKVPATRFASEYLLMPTCKRIMMSHVMSKDLTPIPGAHGPQNSDLIQASLHEAWTNLPCTRHNFQTVWGWISLALFDVLFPDHCHWMSLLPYNGTGLWTRMECVVGALWTVSLLADIFDNGCCRRTFQLTLRIGQWRRMQVLSIVMGSLQYHSSLIDMMFFFYFASLYQNRSQTSAWSKTLQTLTNFCLHNCNHE